jgi:hypothetical protein
MVAAVVGEFYFASQAKNVKKAGRNSLMSCSRLGQRERENQNQN